MTKNETAIAVIEEYLTRRRPGYALSVNAPWGAGKTFLIKRLTAHISKEQAVYISLFGVSSKQDFEQALLKACKIDWTRKLKATIGGTQIGIPGVGSVNLGQFLNETIAWDILSKQIPAIIIIDDVERCLWPLKELFGYLNQFVEHGGKQLVLSENRKGLPTDNETISEREKLIGRTVEIAPDIAAAMPDFIADICGHDASTAADAIKSRDLELIRVFLETPTAISES